MGKGKKRGPAHDPAYAAMLKGVPIPQKLKCSRCDEFKGHATFSERQLNKARSSFRNRTTYNIKCISCTGGQLVEIECSYCGKTKGLKEFAKLQCTSTDSAKCHECTAIQLAIDPVDEQRYEDPRDAFEPAEQSENNWPDYWLEGTVTNSEAGDYDDARSDDGEGGISLPTLHNYPTVPSGTLIDSDDVYSTGSRTRVIKATSSHNHNDKGGLVKLGGGDWTVAPEKSWNTKSVVRNGNSSFNSNGHSDPQSRGTGTSSVSGTSRTFNSNFIDQPPARGWPKIKACRKFEKQEVPDEPKGTVDWESESEDDNDDSDSDDDAEI